MAVAAPPQFGCYPNTDFESLRDSYSQLFSLSHSIEVTRLSHVAAMHDVVLSREGVSDDFAREEIAHLLFVEANMTYRESRENVRIALALLDLPVVTASLATGEISLRQVEYLTQFLTPETEESFMRDINFQSLAQLKRLAEKANLKKREPKPKPVVSARFPSKTRMIVDAPETYIAKAKTAIDRLANAEGIDPVTGLYRSLDERRGDAVIDIICAAIAEDSDPDRASLVIHMTEETFETHSGVVTVNGIPMLFNDIADQVCDSRIRLMYYRNGLPMGVDRLMRDVPPAIRQWILDRDGGCRFPNCLNVMGLHVHHIQWWSLNGPTNIDNLITVCTRHHHMIHDDGWTVVGDPNHHVEFRDPTGRVFTSRVPQLKRSVREFANQILGDQIEGLQLFEPA